MQGLGEAMQRKGKEFVSVLTLLTLTTNSRYSTYLRKGKEFVSVVQKSIFVAKTLSQELTKSVYSRYLRYACYSRYSR